MIAAGVLLTLAVAGAEVLPEAEAKPLVLGHCSGCHSLALVTAQRGDRQFWLDTIRWMQKKHNLWELPADQEAAILDYLAEHFAETDWGRRPALPRALMPGR